MTTKQPSKIDLPMGDPRDYIRSEKQHFPAGSVNTTEISPSKSLSDVLHAVDSRSRAVLAAEEFVAALCRLEIMKGERSQMDRNILAQEDRVRECHVESMRTEKAEMERVIGSKLSNMTAKEWEKLTDKEKHDLVGRINPQEP